MLKDHFLVYNILTSFYRPCVRFEAIKLQREIVDGAGLSAALDDQLLLKNGQSSKELSFVF